MLAGAWSGRWAPTQVDREGTTLGAGGHSEERQQRHRGPRLRVDGPRRGTKTAAGGVRARTRRGAAARRASPAGAVMGAYRGVGAHAAG